MLHKNSHVIPHIHLATNLCRQEGVYARLCIVRQLPIRVQHVTTLHQTARCERGRLLAKVFFDFVAHHTASRLTCFHLNQAQTFQYPPLFPLECAKEQLLDPVACGEQERAPAHHDVRHHQIVNGRLARRLGHPTSARRTIIRLLAGVQFLAQGSVQDLGVTVRRPLLAQVLETVGTLPIAFRHGHEVAVEGAEVCSAVPATGKLEAALRERGKLALRRHDLTRGVAQIAP
mmetsp:Transcript_7800/g.21384  ORF Transcript_7800/g.21384 Transcript_7800/m.21384 type:complete len:231 (+) Transcript_7800:1252-1944(+)